MAPFLPALLHAQDLEGPLTLGLLVKSIYEMYIRSPTPCPQLKSEGASLALSKCIAFIMKTPHKNKAKKREIN